MAESLVDITRRHFPNRTVQGKLHDFFAKSGQLIFTANRLAEFAAIGRTETATEYLNDLTTAGYLEHKIHVEFGRQFAKSFEPGEKIPAEFYSDNLGRTLSLDHCEERETYIRSATPA